MEHYRERHKRFKEDLEEEKEKVLKKYGVKNAKELRKIERRKKR